MQHSAIHKHLRMQHSAVQKLSYYTANIRKGTGDIKKQCLIRDAMYPKPLRLQYWPKRGIGLFLLNLRFLKPINR